MTMPAGERRQDLAQTLRADDGQEGCRAGSGTCNVSLQQQAAIPASDSPKAQEAADKAPGTEANARTGKVPNARRRGGVAVKRAPVAGTRSRPVRCSTTGIPAASSSECAGRSPSAASSMLTE